jgi:hypothetical protein
MANKKEPRRKSAKKTPEIPQSLANASEPPIEPGELIEPENLNTNADIFPAELREHRREGHQGQHKVMSQLVGTLGDVLEEDMQEIDSFLPGETAETKREPGKHKQRLLFVAGVLIMVFAVIGVVSAVVFTAGIIRDFADQTALKNEFTEFVYPLVIADAPNFTKVNELSSGTVLSTAIWRIILQGGSEHYERDMGFMTVPELDVEASAHAIFGDQHIEFVHGTLDNVEVTFDYNAATKSYSVPENPRYMTYIPNISNISNVGETYLVDVDYLLYSPLSVVDEKYDNTPFKTVRFTLQRSGSNVTLSSLELIPDESIMQY